MRFLPVLRAVVVLHVLAMLAQSVTAGLLLSSPGGRQMHVLSGVVLLVVGLAHLVAAILVWRPGGGPAAFVGPAVGLLVFSGVAAALGGMGLKVLHLPLGVLLFGGTIMQLGRVLPRRDPVAA
ncbi:hypothetical protein [Nonomuraea sp. SBT364]|uniref:hypothetical protein n=1 Tax=Nonomuraea sp. SBT364 TaxID=1580530 RepID=UPI0007C727CD|nr:hypothetical protein [Nonomuraea sp. SBT364]